MKRVLAAGGVVISQEGDLLMVYRHTIWDLPKGHLEKGETFEQCALREVCEETGVQQLQLIGFLGISEHDYFDSRLKENAVKETHWFEMKADRSASLQPLENEGIEWAKWIARDDIIRYLSRSYENLIPIVLKSSLGVH